MQDYYHEIKSPSHPKKHRWEVEKLMENPAVGRLWLIQAGHDVVGYLVLTLGYSLEVGGMDAFIDDVYVIPPARHRGFGRAAVQLALGEAAQLGVHAVHLDAEQADERARTLYRSLGFRDRERYGLMSFPFEH
jgi:ribosomal protein S18 acetylase RimI-like enzyme